ncbi:MAG TPA: hypothetical protein VMU60_07235 [Syntrophobacteria bacterium]|nr:hypothetical protein [Syntrophobacteria bacterium]
MNEHERLCGQAVVDFANAESMDEAVSKHFQHVAHIMRFDAGFLEKAKKHFPSWFRVGPKSEAERDFLEAAVREEGLRRDLNKRLNILNPIHRCEVKTCNSLDGTVTMIAWHFKNGQWVYGKPGVDGVYTNPFTETLEEFMDRIKGHAWANSETHGDIFDELPDVNLQLETFKNKTLDVLNEFIQANKQLEIKKTLFSPVEVEDLYSRRYEYSRLKILHERLRIEQSALRKIIDNFLQRVPLLQIKGLHEFAELYNNLPRSRVTIYDDSLTIQHPIEEHDYFSLYFSKNCINRLRSDLAYCLITFWLDDKNRACLHKCDCCDKYFLARKLYASENYFCSGRCRLTWNNRRRLESREAGEDQTSRHWRGNTTGG